MISNGLFFLDIWLVMDFFFNVDYPKGYFYITKKKNSNQGFKVSRNDQVALLKIPIHTFTKKRSLPQKNPKLIPVPHISKWILVSQKLMN